MSRRRKIELVLVVFSCSWLAGSPARGVFLLPGGWASPQHEARSEEAPIVNDAASLVAGPGVCGDGTVDPGEECDDDNTDPGDGCDENCLWENCQHTSCQLYGDVWPPGPPVGDCAVNVCDLVCGLNGFAQIEPCRTNANIHPCPVPNEVMDKGDLLFIMDAYAEVESDSCLHPCAGACCEDGACGLKSFISCDGEYLGDESTCDLDPCQPRSIAQSHHHSHETKVFRQPNSHANSQADLPDSVQAGPISAATIDCRIEPATNIVDSEQVVTVSCFVSVSQTHSLRAYEISLPCCWTPIGGATGSICQAEWGGSVPNCTFPNDPAACTFTGACGSSGGRLACESTLPCITINPGSCGGTPTNCIPVTGNFGYCLNDGFCFDPSPFIDIVRADYVFSPPTIGSPGSFAMNNGNCSFLEPPRLMNSLSNGVGASIGPNTPEYLGSFVYKVSTCAEGQFELPILCGPPGNQFPCGAVGGAGPCGSDATVFLDDDENPIPFASIGPTVTAIAGNCCACVTGAPCQLYGDSFPPGPPSGDCVVDVSDIGCVLDGFAGQTGCDVGADIRPCPFPDGNIDVDDIGATLDAFAGIVTPPCAHPCAGACCNGSACSLANENGCAGTYLGNGTLCGPGACP